jgi:hypothetical protein
MTTSRIASDLGHSPVAAWAWLRGINRCDAGRGVVAVLPADLEQLVLHDVTTKLNGRMARSLPPPG